VPLTPSQTRLGSLAIVLPAFNEEENIASVVQSAAETAQGLADEYEVIVVDDGSHDRTAEIVRGLMRDRDWSLRLLTHPQNLGYGVALRTGFAHVDSECVFYTDTDNQFDVSELRYFVPFLAEADVVIGFRVYRYDSPYRTLASWGYNALVRGMFRVRVRDVDCAFTLFRREVLDQITIESEDFFVDTELIAKARKWNYRIVEKGVRHYPRAAGETTVRPGDIPRTLRTVFRMWRRIQHPTQKQIDRQAEIRAGAASNAEEHSELERG
jgi:glycosyltransferase involved in cell wall biosynthesis